MPTTRPEGCLVDTNVLLAACDPRRESHLPCRRFLEEGLLGKRSLYAPGQVFREFLVVATRPRIVNGLGLASLDALHDLGEFRRCIRLLDETRDSHDRLIGLVRDHGLQGRRIHDANIVAVMASHGLSRLVTLNPADFTGFPGLVLVRPPLADPAQPSP